MTIKDRTLLVALVLGLLAVVGSLTSILTEALVQSHWATVVEQHRANLETDYREALNTTER